MANRRSATGPFDVLGFRQRRRIATLITSHEIDAGVTLMSIGESADRFVFLFDGAVEVVDGESVLRTVEPGGFFGELAMLPHISGSDTRTASVHTLTDCVIGVCDPNAFAAIIEHYPRVGGQILAQAYSLSLAT